MSDTRSQTHGLSGGRLSVKWLSCWCPINNFVKTGCGLWPYGPNKNIAPGYQDLSNDPIPPRPAKSDSLVILHCLMSDDFTRQGRASGWETFWHKGRASGRQRATIVVKQWFIKKIPFLAALQRISFFFSWPLMFVAAKLRPSTANSLILLALLMADKAICVLSSSSFCLIWHLVQILNVS